MNRLLSIPSAAIALMHAFTRSLPPTTSSPPSVVTSFRFSGTTHTDRGLSLSANSTIAWVHAISGLRRVDRDSRRRQTSRSWMCLRSSLRWAVIPSAPARTSVFEAGRQGLAQAPDIPVLDVPAVLPQVGRDPVGAGPLRLLGKRYGIGFDGSARGLPRVPGRALAQRRAVVDVHTEEDHPSIQTKFRPPANLQKSLYGGPLPVDHLGLRREVPERGVECVALDPLRVAARDDGLCRDLGGPGLSLRDQAPPDPSPAHPVRDDEADDFDAGPGLEGVAVVRLEPAADPPVRPLRDDHPLVVPGEDPAKPRADRLQLGGVAELP